LAHGWSGLAAGLSFDRAAQAMAEAHVPAWMRELQQLESAIEVQRVVGQHTTDTSPATVCYPAPWVMYGHVTTGSTPRWTQPLPSSPPPCPCSTLGASRHGCWRATL
jgi:hypothetical protein